MTEEKVTSSIYPFFNSELGMFFPCEIKDPQGRKYACAQAYFEALKCAREEDKQWFIAPTNGFQAYQKSNKLDKKQDFNPLEAMKEVIEAKFTQNLSLSRFLINTGNSYLIDVSTSESYWASGPDLKGNNHLGKILMEAREKLGGEGMMQPPTNMEELVPKCQKAECPNICHYDEKHGGFSKACCKKHYFRIRI